METIIRLANMAECDRGICLKIIMPCIHTVSYTHLVLTEKLWKHLEEVDMECNDMMDMLTVRMAEREGVTEHLKSVDQLGWVRKMNSIRSRAEEVVLHDLIYMD